jgi:hypothetical protein
MVHASDQDSLKLCFDFNGLGDDTSAADAYQTIFKVKL